MLSVISANRSVVLYGSSAFVNKLEIPLPAMKATASQKFGANHCVIVLVSYLCRTHPRRDMKMRDLSGLEHRMPNVPGVDIYIPIVA